MGRTRWLGISAGALLAAAVLAPVDASAVDFVYINDQENAEARGIAHGAHGWLYMGKKETRTANITFHGGHEEEYDVNLMENKTSGGELYCYWRIKVTQSSSRSYCSILKKESYTSRSCSGSTDFYPDTCAFFFSVR